MKHGSNVWFEREAKDLLPEGFTHPGSPNGEFRKEKQTSWMYGSTQVSSQPSGIRRAQ